MLDFGLAKAISLDTQPDGSALSSPTITMSATVAGMILGTAAYMSPEQARGKLVDYRADIWSFGVILYELLTGFTLFTGETVTDVLASVVRHEPEWDRIPPKLRRLLRACLQREPKQRLQAIGDWALLLAEDAAPTETKIATRRPVLPWIVAAVLALAAAFGWWRATRPVDHPLLRFSADMGPDAIAGTRITAAISPDGTRLAFPVRGASGTTLLATRTMDESTPATLAGTEGAADPFFSPDGQWIGFVAAK